MLLLLLLLQLKLKGRSHKITRPQWRLIGDGVGLSAVEGDRLFVLKPLRAVGTDNMSAFDLHSAVGKPKSCVHFMAW